MQDFAFIDGIDWNKPDGKTDDGLSSWNIRCKIPFCFDMLDDVHLKAVEAAVERGIDEVGGDKERDTDGHEHEVIDPQATGVTGSDDEVAFDEVGLLSGIASSTSVDFFGTEMSLRALRGMQLQMTVAPGVPYVPGHNTSGGAPMEWDDVIGRTIHAEVVPVDGDKMAKPHNASEQHFKLRTTIQLLDEPKAHKLVRRIKRGERIGQSIGGWFTQLQVIQNDEGKVERIIVLGVDLDHLAVTRAPANADADRIIQLRGALSKASIRSKAANIWSHLDLGETVMAARSIVSAVEEMGQLEKRHVLDVVDNQDGTVSIRYAVNEAHDENEELSTPAPEPTKTILSSEQSETDSPAVDTDSQSEERTMSANEELLAAFRTMLDDAITPLSQRLDSVESGVEARNTPPVAAPEVAPVEQRAAPVVDTAAVVELAAMKARAAAAESALAQYASQPNRVGRSVSRLAIPHGPGAAPAYRSLIQQARTSCPTLSAVADSVVGVLTEPTGTINQQRRKLEETLTALFMAAEDDGVITDPYARVGWQ